MTVNGSNILGLITAILALLGAFATVIKLEDYPKTRVVLIVIVLAAAAAFARYVAPGLLTGKASLDSRLQQIKDQADMDVENEARNRERAREQAEKAENDRRIYEAEKQAAEARHAREVEEAAEAERQKYLAELQKAQAKQALIDAQTHLLGSWKCKLGITWVFSPDGQLDTGIIHSTYTLQDPTHITVKNWTGTMTYVLDMHGDDEKILRFGMVTCQRPKS